MTKARSNAVANAAKGDLTVGTGTNLSGILPVSATNGDTIVADSSTSTGLRYQGNYAAGRNAIINGAFDNWQRGTSFANLGAFLYFSDRFYSVSNNSGGTITLSRQTFTGTDIPVAGAQYYFRTVGASPTGASFNVFGQKIENVQTFANQTITLSFYAKSDSSRLVTPNLFQDFGSGGSSQVSVSGSAITLTTSWARYSQTLTVPSISGKTIGTSSMLKLEFSQPLNVSHTLEYYGIQVEAGSVATAFQTATGTIQGELAACQRYYYRQSGTTDGGNFNVTGIGNSTTNVTGVFQVPVTMRVKPPLVDFSLVGVTDTVNAFSVSNITVSGFGSNDKAIVLNLTAGGLTQFRPYAAQQFGSGTGHIGVSAEL